MGKSRATQTASAASASATELEIYATAAAASTRGLKAAERRFGGSLALHELRTLHEDGSTVFAIEAVPDLLYDHPCVGVGVQGASCALLGVDIHGIVFF